MTLRTLFASALVSTALLASPAWAQDDDELDDILDDLFEEDAGGGDEGSDEPGDDPLDESEDDVLTGDDIAAERRAVEEGNIDDTIGANTDEIVLPEDEKKDRRVIKTLQQKNFLKLKRYEISPHIGAVTNDPFINRYLVGASFAYHATEIFAFELTGSFSPDFGTGDWKPITEQLVNENQVSPDISKILYYANANFQFSPIYGKIAVGNRKIIRFDIFLTVGTGIVHTVDDLEALQCEEETSCQATQSQNHPTTNFGGGFRVIFSENFAARLNVRNLSYVETVNSTTLEMKNNLLVTASASFFFPGMNK